MFNAEKYIETCLDSILTQTLDDLEIVVVDDCSTDRSYKIVKKYDDPRIKLFRQKKNSGHDGARNLGIQNARGKYIYFMDADDALMPNTLETLVNSAEEYDSDVVVMNSRYDTQDANFVFNSRVKINKSFCPNPQPRFFSNNITERLQQEYFSRSTYWESWIKIQRRDFLIENRILFPNTWATCDKLFYLSELCLAKSVRLIDFCGYVYRHHVNQQVSSSADKSLKMSTQTMPNAIEYIQALFQKLSLPQESKDYLFTKAMLEYFEITVALAYRRISSKEQIEKILHEIIIQNEFLNPQFMLAMFNMLASATVENMNYRIAIQQIKNDVNQRWVTALQQTIQAMQ